MIRLVVILFIATGLLAIGSIGESYGSAQISISASKPVYSYGESLSFSIRVSNVTGDNAVLEIVDQANQSSGPVPTIITKPVSNFTAPFPFYRTTYAPGTYFLKIQYAGASAVTSFQLVDTGNIAIPPQFKEVASSWVQNQTSSRLFGEHIAALVSSGTIKIDGYHEQNVTSIPQWFRNDALWWSNGSISDSDFGHAIEYLIESDIMRV
ncbi:MAG: hypothetical protein KGI27_10635 [Thaumarchaeota archaeon]|nr:hypothetical protein [Nitrososphaerota archaeon]